MAWTEEEKAYQRMCLRNSMYPNFWRMSEADKLAAEKRIETALTEKEKNVFELEKLRGAPAKMQDRATEFYTGF